MIPRSRLAVVVVAALTLGASCDAGQPHALFVEVLTDLVPGVEFTSVRTELLTELPRDGMAEITRGIEFPLDPGADFVRGERVADFEGLTAGPQAGRVRLVAADGAVVAERVFEAAVRGALAVRIVITRDCVDLSCPVPGGDSRAIACVGGRCAQPTCIEPTDPGCEVPECLDVVHCEDSADACSVAACLQGVCFYAPDDASCAGGARCIPGRGCVEAGSDAGAPDDAGGPEDGGGPDAGELDAGASDAGDTDAGHADAGEPDAGEPDAGEPDAGELDAGELDAGELDAGELDAGGVDACVPADEVCNGRDDDCDGRVDEGFDLAIDPAHCGECELACPGAVGGMPACVAGECVIACDPGRADCGGGSDCETLLGTASDCGGCGEACSEPTPVCDAGTGTCSSGCDPGETRCGASCVETSTSTAHCGGCGVECGAGETCVGGRCTCGSSSAEGEVCTGSRDCCGTSCRDLSTDELRCGACGVRCGANETCRGGRCECGPTRGSVAGGSACGGDLCCSGECVDEQRDENHCGTCTSVCGEGEHCSFGRCACGGMRATTTGPICGASEICCGATECTDISSDPDRCGSCSWTCPADETCSGGLCRCGSTASSGVGSEACPGAAQCCPGLYCALPALC